jgi:hypothetical protein
MRSYLNLKYYTGICLEGLRKPTKTLARVAGIRPEI